MKWHAAESLFMTAWLATGLLVSGQELPMFGQLPKLDIESRINNGYVL